MSVLSTFLAWFAVGTNGFLFATSAAAFLFMLMIAVVLFKAIRKLDLSSMFYDTGSTIVSSTKFWSVIAYFVATIAFLFINIAAPAAASLEFIWLAYLGIIAGSASVNKLISARYGVTDQSGQKLDP